MPRDLAELERYALEHIPLARAMQLSATAFDGARLTLSAPLAPNINDKGCAFGGSLTSIMTLAGWGATVLALAAREIAADVFVARSEVRFLAPLFGPLVAVAAAAPGQSIDAFVTTLQTRGKARFRIEAAIAGDGRDACTLSADFAARLRS